MSDVPKTMVYEIARHVNSRSEVIPEHSITRAPSAELRPDQTDEDIERKHETCVRMLEERGSATECLAPREREELSL